MKVKALCVDPGTTNSGYAIFDGEKVYDHDSEIKNKDLLTIIEQKVSYDILVMETISSYGMPVGQSTFETCIWIGRFGQEFGWERTRLIYRRDIKMHLCNSARAKDPHVRRAVLDKFPATGGGKTPEIGVMKQPGPLFGMTSHAISALAVGIAYFEREKEQDFVEYPMSGQTK